MRLVSRGFTLLEIIIALAITALGIAAVAKATGGAVTAVAETKERMLAVWVAGNHLSELKIIRAWPAAGSYEATRTMGGRTWYLTQAVSNTGNQDVRRVDIQVYTDPQRRGHEFEVYGYIARYRPPAEFRENESNDGSGEDQESAESTEEENGTPLPGEEAETGGDAQPARVDDTGDSG